VLRVACALQAKKKSEKDKKVRKGEKGETAQQRLVRLQMLLETPITMEWRLQLEQRMAKAAAEVEKEMKAEREMAKKAEVHMSKLLDMVNYLLLERDGTRAVYTKNGRGDTPLHYAALLGCPRLLRLMLSSGFRPEETSEFTATHTGWFSRNKIGHTALSLYLQTWFSCGTCAAVTKVFLDAMHNEATFTRATVLSTGRANMTRSICPTSLRNQFRYLLDPPSTEQSADTSVNRTRFNYGDTLLHLVARLGDPELITALAERCEHLVEPNHDNLPALLVYLLESDGTLSEKVVMMFLDRMHDNALFTKQYGSSTAQVQGTVLHYAAWMPSKRAGGGNMTKRDLLRALFARRDSFAETGARPRKGSLDILNARGHYALQYLMASGSGHVYGDMVKAFAERMSVSALTTPALASYDSTRSLLYLAACLSNTEPFEVIIQRCLRGGDGADGADSAGDETRPNFFVPSAVRAVVRLANPRTCALFAYLAQYPRNYEFSLVHMLVTKTAQKCALATLEFCIESPVLCFASLTLLQYAARRGDARLLRFFFEEVCERKLDPTNANNGDSALATYLRAEHRKPISASVVELMLGALDRATLCNGLYGMVSVSMHATLGLVDPIDWISGKMLLGHTEHIGPYSDTEHGATLLHIVCSTCYVQGGATAQELVALLLARGASVLVANLNEETVLARTCRLAPSHLNVEFLQWLLSVAPEVRDTVREVDSCHRSTALHHVASKRLCGDVALFLLERFGADPLATDRAGRTPLMIWYPKLTAWRALLRRDDICALINQCARHCGCGCERTPVSLDGIHDSMCSSSGKLFVCAEMFRRWPETLSPAPFIALVIEHGAALECFPDNVHDWFRFNSADYMKNNVDKRETLAVLDAARIASARIASLVWRPWRHQQIGVRWRQTMRSLYMLARAQWEPCVRKRKTHRYRYEGAQLHRLPEELLQYICEMITHAPHRGTRWWVW
jgi:ankyrin repeat protein